MWKLAVLLLLVQTTPTPAAIILHERHAPDLQVCAEYTTVDSPRLPARSCVDASVVRAFILRNAEPDQCH